MINVPPATPPGIIPHQRTLSRKKDSFTLVEMIVAMAVLSIIVLAMSSMMDFVLRNWESGINATNNFSKARTMLTTLDRDTQTMFLRRDLSAFTDNTGTASLCTFYSAVQAESGYGSSGLDTRQVGIVQYALSQLPSPAAATNSVLQRFCCGMNYSTTSPLTPSVGYSTNMIQLTNSLVTAVSPEVISSGVIAFQWQFVDGTGGLVTPPYVPAGTTTAAVPFYYNFSAPSASYNPRGVVVSLVVASDNAYQLAIQTGNLSKLIALFPTQIPAAETATAGDTVYDTQTFAQLWNSVLNPSTGTFGQGLPRPLTGSGSLEVFERYIPLPITTPSK